MARSVNLTVIGDVACSTTRTYLTYLREAGMRPRRLWLVDFMAPSARLVRVRSLLGERVAEWWRRRWDAPAPATIDAAHRSLCLQLQEQAGLPAIDHAEPWDPEGFADEVDRLCAADYQDPLLQRRVLASPDTAFLYTNGGIVPAALLDRPEVRVLHIHPGIVPAVRGSDCLLWSAHVRRRLGVSCFYMSPGIDEGAVIGTLETDLPRLPVVGELLAQGREPDLYRALLFAVDPHLRAQLLVQVLRQHPDADLRRLPSQPQAKAQRPAYLWMHPRLRARVMREAFL